MTEEKKKYPNNKVKCPYCGKSFNRNNTDFVMVGNRYAHRDCAAAAKAAKTQEEKDLEDLYYYCKDLFGKNLDFMGCKRMVHKWHKDEGMTYSGMKKTLQYCYEIKKMSLDRAEGRIGIVPYMYNEAKEYWRKVDRAQKVNANKELREDALITVTIPRPQSKERKRELFTFLDEDNE